MIERCREVHLQAHYDIKHESFILADYKEKEADNRSVESEAF